VARLAVADTLADGLASDDPHAVAAAIAAIEHGPANMPVLLAAARACEDKLADPERALALYERILREQPDASVAAAAERRATELRATATGPFARDFAELITNADQLAVVDVIVRGDALAAATWPGAADATLWLADWLRRTGRYDAAEAHYAIVIARWPSSARAAIAARCAAGSAIDAHAWDRGRALAEQLPDVEPSDRLVRAELLDAARRGQARARLSAIAWLVVAIVVLGLLGSLLEAARRGGWRRPPLRPPTIVWFVAPLAAVMIGVSLTAQQPIAPAVVRISVAAIVLVWLSGTALALLRSRRRATRARSIAHAVACMLAIAAIAYTAVTRDGLIDALAETVGFAPES
jgi:tetratricopeptide (TPR) repeat protein